MTPSALLLTLALAAAAACQPAAATRALQTVANGTATTHHKHLPLTDDQYTTVKTAQIIAGVPSLLGALFVVASYASVPQLRSFQMRLVLMMSIADFMATLSVMMPLPDEGSAACALQGMAQQFWICSVLWSAAVAFVLHATVVRRVEASVLESHERMMHLVCWGLPAVFMFLPFLSEGYTGSGTWCWISNANAASKALRFGSFYLWVVAGVAFSLFSYVQVINAFKELTANAGQSKEDTKPLLLVFQRLQLYPLVTAVCWTPGLIHRVHNIFVDSSTSLSTFSFVLLLLHSIFVALSGFLNATAFGVRSQAFSSMFARFCGPANAASEQESLGTSA